MMRFIRMIGPEMILGTVRIDDVVHRLLTRTANPRSSDLSSPLISEIPQSHLPTRMQSVYFGVIHASWIGPVRFHYEIVTPSVA